MKKCVCYVVLVTISIFSLILYPSSLSQTSTRLYGRILDQDGNPIPNAKVVVMDWSYTVRYRIIFTDEDGWYSTNVPVGHRFKVYAYYDNPDTPGVDYAPSSSKDYLAIPEKPLKIPDIHLVKSASINITGIIWYVESGLISPSFKIIVIDPETQLPVKIFEYINVYGDDEVSWFVNSRWKRLVIIPADKMVDLKIVARVYGLEGIKIIQFKIDNGGKHFRLSQGEFISYAVTHDAFLLDISIAEKSIYNAWKIIDNAEKIGFYVAPQKDKLLEANKLLEEASNRVNLGKYDIVTQSALRRVFEISSKKIVLEINELETTAYNGAIVLPIFLSAFAITLAFFFFEDNRKKLIFTIIFYLIIIGVFIVTYPGAPLVISRNLEIFLMSILGSIIGLVFIVFILPKLFKEPEGTVKISMRNTIAVTFMLGKRYVKLRKFRAILNLTSIIILIAAVTTMTSMYSIYGLQVQTKDTDLPSNMLMFKNIPSEGNAFIPIDEITAREISNIFNTTAAVKAETLPPPLNQPVLYLKHDEQEYKIYGVIGIDPKNEKAFVQIPIVKGTQDVMSNSVILPMILSYRLNINIGDKIVLMSSKGGIKRVFGTFVVKGFFDDKKMSSLKEFDGNTYLPLRYVTGKNKKVVLKPCNSSDIIIMSLDTVFRLAEKPHDIQVGISRVILKVSPSIKDIVDKITSIVYAKGLQAWFVQGGKLKHFFLGSRVEVKGHQVIIPAIIVALTITITMFTAVRERRHEILVYMAVGFNPTQVALTFIAESITMGLIGGGIGYLLGLSLYKLAALFFSSYNIGMRENLHWWMSVVSIIAALGVTIPATLKPAIDAAMMTVPSRIRRVKVVSEKEKVKREERIFKAYTDRTLALPVTVSKDELEIFIGYVYSQLEALKAGFTEHVENLKELPEEIRPDGTHRKVVTFEYIIMRGSETYITVNDIILEMKPGTDHYIIHIKSDVKSGTMPERIRERIMDLVREIVMNWKKQH